ncbi:MAG: sigma 54-interacting transcriptional regulator [Nannocystaceae bacterium]|nr:sigma 54-dependent Fis family transcriptional regulator [bacterium]
MDEFERFTQTLTQLSEREFAQERPRRLALHIVEGQQQRTLERGGTRILIGAHPDADIQLSSDSASTVHCELVLSDSGNILLRDLGSKNGTWVGHGISVREAVLEPGATFSVGSSTITVAQVGDERVFYSTRPSFGSLIGRGSAMAELFARLERIASVNIDALVTGETGTGKELVARAIHDSSSRSSGPFVVIDGTTLNSGNVENDLFGHRRGAFTGAEQDQAGLFEHASGGTLFIDEVGELPLNLQPKLLRALENRTIRRVGDPSYRSFDARVISATHRDLPRMVNEGTFREDLYYRLARVQVTVPALRERDKSNISMLADAFLERFSVTRDDGVPLSFDRDAYAALKGHRWPGNVRELKNTIERAAALCIGPIVRPTDLDLAPTVAGPRATTSALFDKPWKDSLAEFERSYAERALTEASGNRSEAARRAGMSRNGFSNLLKRAGIG